ncbi:MAG: hypothetical protein KGJ59_07780 [Bacteroidota bacterium]|nr:hypothetical protein [Bacteroidota bacterium]
MLTPVMKFPRFPSVTISQEMLDEAVKLVNTVEVKRTKASPFDTLAGILGELAFAQFLYGDLRKNNVGNNKGKSDFRDVEIKTSAFPFSTTLHLLVREEYKEKRKPPFYVQIIVDLKNTDTAEIHAGRQAFLCGFATSEEVDRAPKKDFGSKASDSGNYECFYIPIAKLHPMKDFSTALFSTNIEMQDLF